MPGNTVFFDTNGWLALMNASNKRIGHPIKKVKLLRHVIFAKTSRSL
jgi:hypothetical protein